MNMSSFGGFGSSGFGTPNNNQQSTGFGGFGSSANNTGGEFTIYFYAAVEVK